MKPLRFALLPLLCLIACAAPEGTPEFVGEIVPAEIAQGETADNSPPTLTFGANWSVALAGRPQVGGPLRLVYDLARLSQCRGSGWTIMGYSMTNQGPVTSFLVANATNTGTAAETSLYLTTGGDLELWFRVWDDTGCSAWDSNLGWNFHTKVWQDPTLTFNEGWTHSLFGTLRGGSTLMVDYDIDRLGQCRAMYMNYHAWSVDMMYRFDGGPVQSAPVTLGYGEYNSQFRRQVPAFIPVPVGAQHLELWFVNGDRKGCSAYDSKYGQNYHFSVQ